MEILTIIVLYFVVILLFLLFVEFRWIINTIRDISKDYRGYTKFIQTIFVFLLISIFLIILTYYLLDKGTVDRIDIILTVVVGWLGLVIGRFFGERTMEALEEKRTSTMEETREYIKKITETTNQLVSELKEE